MFCLYFNSFSFFDDEQERALQVCTYSGSSSDTETELEDTGSTLGSPQRTLIHRAKKRDSGAFESCHFSLLLVLFFPPLFPFITKILRLAVDRNEETLKRSSVEKSLSIMDYYQHDVFTHLEKDSRRISQYNLLHKESSLDSTAGERLSVSIKTAVTAVKTLYRHAGDSYEAFYCSSHPRMTSRNLRRQWYLLTYSDDGCSQWLISLTLKEKSKIRTAN